jgi:hypothetical protein
MFDAAALQSVCHGFELNRPATSIQQPQFEAVRGGHERACVPHFRVVGLFARLAVVEALGWWSIHSTASRGTPMDTDGQGRRTLEVR